MLQPRPEINSCSYTSFNQTAIYQMSYRKLVLHDKVSCATANFKSWPSSLCIPSICFASGSDNRNHTQTVGILEFPAAARQYSSVQLHSDTIHIKQTSCQSNEPVPFFLTDLIWSSHKNAFIVQIPLLLKWLKLHLLNQSQCLPGN